MEETPADPRFILGMQTLFAANRWRETAETETDVALAARWNAEAGKRRERAFELMTVAPVQR
jgi:peroxiredoxin